MTVVPVSQLKIGDKVAEQVYTRRGSLLLDKDTYVTQRELDILRAFFIPSVTIGAKGEAAGHSPADKDEIAPVPESLLVTEYENLLALLRKVWYSLRSGGTLSLLELRTRLEALLQHTDEYHILKFTPRSINLREYILHSSIMVALTSHQIAKWHGLPSKDWVPVALGGLLHDIGNARVEESILEKQGSLTRVEQEEMRTHTIYGYQMLKNVPGLNEGIKMCALQHHEREDSSGYPMAVKGEKIHPYAKIVAVADIYHAMTGPRYYRKASSPYHVLEQLQAESFGKLEPAVVQTFIQRVTEFHNGTLVRLNDGRIGAIVFSDRNNPTRPLVNVNGDMINLTLERSLFIQDVIYS